MHTSRTARTAATRRTVATDDASRLTARIRKMNVDGTGAASILHPADPRTAHRGKGKPKDHFRENINAMREQQRENRLRKELQSLEEQAAGAFKLKRFEGVESRLSTHRSTDTARSKPFLRKSEGKTAAKAKPPRASEPVRPFRRPGKEAKPPVPRAVEVAPLAPREEKDFIKSNYHEAPRLGRRTSKSSEDSSPSKRKGYGEVPKYLQSRQEEWAAEDARREEEESNPCPPGMSIMPEEERLETLGVLKDSLAEANALLFKMPLKVETAGQIRRKSELEAKIKELEDAIAIFGRDVVFVEAD